MLRKVCRAKIHRATVTSTDLHYEGSITLDTDLIRAVDIAPYELVQVVNVNNGSRLETYVIPAEAGSGTVMLNGPAARRGEPGDKIIIISYGLVTDDEAAGGRKPRVAIVDEQNRIVKIAE